MNKAKERPLEYTLHSPYSGVRTLAIAPSFNLSPSHDFDPLVVSDLLFAELQGVESINALPVNRTLAVMAESEDVQRADGGRCQALATAHEGRSVIVPKSGPRRMTRIARRRWG